MVECEVKNDSEPKKLDVKTGKSKKKDKNESI